MRRTGAIWILAGISLSCSGNPCGRGVPASGTFELASSRPDVRQGTVLFDANEVAIEYELQDGSAWRVTYELDRAAE